MKQLQELRNEILTLRNYGVINKEEEKSLLTKLNSVKEQLTLTDVVKQSELLFCKGKCDHGYRDEFGNDLFCSIKEKSAN